MESQTNNDKSRRVTLSLLRFETGTLLRIRGVFKALIIDDDVELTDVIALLFKEAGWAVEKAHSGADGLQFLRNFKFDLIILDWNLPDVSGVELCQQYRRDKGETPILFLTGRNTINDKELGFDAGGDEYIAKPFDSRELLMRARAMMRRPKHLSAETLTIKDVRIDFGAKRLVSSQASVQLSSTEFAILEHMLRNAGTFYTANQLFEELWPLATDTTSDVVRVHIKILRRKLQPLGLADLIKTVRGAGYILERPET